MVCAGDSGQWTAMLWSAPYVTLPGDGHNQLTLILMP